MQNYLVKAAEPTILDGQKYHRLQNNDLVLTYKVDTAHVVPGPIDVPRFNDALARALSVYPLYAGRIRRGAEFWQIQLVNPGVPVAIIDSDAAQEVPHNCITQSPWTLSQPINGHKQWEYDCDEPLLRVTLTRFTKLGSTCVALSASHALGDGFTISRFLRLLSANYQGLPPPDAPPTYTPPPPSLLDPGELAKVEAAAKPVFAHLHPISEPPPFLRADWTPASRVDVRFTDAQVRAVQAAVRALAPDADGEADAARRISRQDALWALLVFCMARVDPECAPQHLNTIINGRGIPPRSATAMTNSLIWAQTEPVADPGAETVYSIARRVRHSIDEVRRPAFAAACEAVHDRLALQTANADLAQNFVQPPGSWVLNSTWRFDWTSAHFGYEGKARFFHTQMSAPRFAKMFTPNPEVMPDGTIRPSPYDVEVTFYLYAEPKARFRPVLLEELAKLEVTSEPLFVDTT